jgi:hypothetical protein
MCFVSLYIQRTRDQLEGSLRASHADLLGIGRPSVAFPNLPRLLLQPSPTQDDGDPLHSSSTNEDGPLVEFPRLPQEPRPSWSKWMKLINAGIGTAWWVAIMHRLAGSRQQPGRGPRLDENMAHRDLGPLRAMLKLLFGPRLTETL